MTPFPSRSDCLKGTLRDSSLNQDLAILPHGSPHVGSLSREFLGTLPQRLEDQICVPDPDSTLRFQLMQLGQFDLDDVAVVRGGGELSCDLGLGRERRISARKVRFFAKDVMREILDVGFIRFCAQCSADRPATITVIAAKEVPPSARAYTPAIAGLLHFSAFAILDPRSAMRANLYPHAQRD
jgi:hypothetical protein